MITRLPFLSFVFLAAAVLSGAPSEPVGTDKIAANAESTIERAGLRADAPALAAAVQSLDAALAVAPPGPAWGHADALVWLGIAQQRAGDSAAARAAWQQALAIEPGFAWVKYALLPSLDRPSPSR